MKCHYCLEDITPYEKGARMVPIKYWDDKTASPLKMELHFHRRCYSKWFKRMLDRPRVTTFFR